VCVGTEDLTGYMSIGVALQFFRALGGHSEIWRHNHDLCVWACGMLAKRCVRVCGCVCVGVRVCVCVSVCPCIIGGTQTC